MSLVNLSLDEIIARRKRTDKKTNGSVSRFRNIKKKKDYAPEYAATNLAFTRPEASLLDVPSGKWDHSGFEEMYGIGSGDGPLPAPERSGKFNRVDLARKVRLHITNLAPTVNSADLNELFEEYSIHSATVNYNEMGESVGTADVVTDRVTAREIIANLDGVALDGEVMAFHMIDDQAVPINRIVRIKDRLSFREHSGGITKKRLPKRTFTETNNRRKNRPKRLQMTDEELDRELEEYMNKRSQKQNEQKMEI
ncbi:hypothetical protein X798_02511 [Onchocerca flexuosa]|uniref:RRM domain-containing protein n=1 Tax=Onchocerca flexuosa TaxID=387005 RepID=A0A238BYW1_9BILA|nr:hypothetical protein X798_02511 [Onchocerca flexuosa]